MNLRKIFLFCISFLLFLLSGLLVSRVQSDNANLVMQDNGLSANSRYLKFTSKEKIASFLVYLERRYKKRSLQLHLTNKKNRHEVLVWANKNVSQLPLSSGRYFTKDDFASLVPLVVISPQTQDGVINRQSNQYLYWHKRYLSVIGTLKSKGESCFISTGPRQITAQMPLNHYQLTADAGNEGTIRGLARHERAKIIVPEFVKKHRHHQLTSVLPRMLLLLVLLLLNCLIMTSMAIYTSKSAELSHLHGKLLNNWLINRSLRGILIEVLLMLAVLGVVNWRFFLSDQMFLFWVLFAELISSIVIYLIVIWRHMRANA